jgi:hypothetical protein
MSRPILDRQVFFDLSWWHWALTIPLLAARLAGYPGALLCAAGLCAAAGGYFWRRLRQVRPYPVQVRIAYLGLLAVGSLPWMQWLHWVQLFGTTAMVTVGYCPLIRLLSLAPPNRTEPLTAPLVWRVFVTAPGVGGLVKWPVAAPSRMACGALSEETLPACSLPRFPPREPGQNAEKSAWIPSH